LDLFSHEELTPFSERPLFLGKSSSTPTHITIRSLSERPCAFSNCIVRRGRNSGNN
jgi:hypothetical protein